MSKHNILLLGPIGTGKTTSLRTIIENTEKELFIVATEPGIHTILGDLPEDRCHWHYIPQAKTDWDVLQKNARLINSLTMGQLQELKGMNRSEYGQFIEVLDTFADFHCDRCGGEYGMIDDWGEDRVLAVDGLTGLSIMSMDLTVGAKPIKTQPEWGVAMDNLERLIGKLTGDTRCNFVLISHMAREKNEVTGGTIRTVDTLGNKLAPKIPKPFDEVIEALRSGDKFFWSTVGSDVDLKSRVLPLSGELPPDFSQIFTLQEEKEL